MACFRGSIEILILFHGSEAVFGHMQEYGNLHKDMYVQMYEPVSLYIGVCKFVHLTL